MKVKVAQLCLTLCDSINYTVHGVLETRILEWVAFPFSKRSSQPRDWTQVSSITGGFFTNWGTREAHAAYERYALKFKTQIKSKRMEKDFCAKSKHKTTEVVTLILDEADIRIRDITRYEEGHFMMTKRSIHQEDTAILSVYIRNNKA